MKTIIGYTDSINECDCCGKKELKGTYCIDLDGVELYYGSVCAFKNHGLSMEDQKELKSIFNKKQKNQKLYDLHILPVKEKLRVRLENAFTTNVYEELTEVAKKLYHQIEADYNSVIQYKAKKYKIALN